MNSSRFLLTEVTGQRIAEALEQMSERANAGLHNSRYRGICLGTSVTEEQWQAIKSGSFDDMFIGDYWEIDSVKWRIAAFDYHLNRGPDADITTRHHLVIVPDSNLLDNMK